MKYMAIFGFIASLLGFGCKQTENRSPSMGPELRTKILTTNPSEFELVPTKEFPRVYGVLMDWPVDDQTVTVVGMSDGNASLYTTSSFGVIGGVGHETVRNAAKDFVKKAEALFDLTQPTADHSYPGPGQIRFYLLTFQGLRFVEAPGKEISEGNSQLSELGNMAQHLITELRLVSEKKENP